MGRVSSPAKRAPQTLDQAIVLATRFAELDAKADDIEAQRKDAIASVNATADGELVTIVAELKDIAKQLKPWWAANVEQLTEGKRKSKEIGGCMVGYRLSPAAVNFTGGTDKEATLKLRAAQQIAFVRFSAAPDKVKIMAALEAARLAAMPVPEGVEVAPPTEDQLKEIAAGQALASLGFKIKQTEAFFVERVAQGGTIAA